MKARGKKAKKKKDEGWNGGKKENSECSRFLLLLFHAATARLSSLVQFTWSCNFTSTAAAPLSCFLCYVACSLHNWIHNFFLFSSFVRPLFALMHTIHSTPYAELNIIHCVACIMMTTKLWSFPNSTQRELGKNQTNTKVSRYNEFKFENFLSLFRNFSSSFVSSVIEFSVFLPQSYAMLFCKKKLSMHIYRSTHIEYM